MELAEGNFVLDNLAAALEFSRCFNHSLILKLFPVAVKTSSQESQFASRAEYMQFCQHHEMHEPRCACTGLHYVGLLFLAVGTILSAVFTVTGRHGWRFR